MCLCVLEHFALLGFELMCCYKLEFLSDDLQQEFSWCFVFTPLFVESLLAMVVSVYCIRHEKTFEVRIVGGSREDVGLFKSLWKLLVICWPDL